MMEAREHHHGVFLYPVNHLVREAPDERPTPPAAVGERLGRPFEDRPHRVDRPRELEPEARPCPSYQVRAASTSACASGRKTRRRGVTPRRAGIAPRAPAPTGPRRPDRAGARLRVGRARPVVPP
jgi:hypothetical protein